MEQHDDLATIARAIIDANLYMTLGTAGADGRPWVSPVYFATAAYTEFLWVSDPEATHSRNLATRPEASIVVFDSQAPINTGQAVYTRASAEELTGRERERGIEIFSRRSQVHGAREWTLEDVDVSARLRLYRATASEPWVLDPADVGDKRTSVAL